MESRGQIIELQYIYKYLHIRDARHGQNSFIIGVKKRKTIKSLYKHPVRWQVRRRCGGRCRGNDCQPSAAPACAANRLIGEVVQSRRRPLLGPSPG